MSRSPSTTKKEIAIPGEPTPLLLNVGVDRVASAVWPCALHFIGRLFSVLGGTVEAEEWEPLLAFSTNVKKSLQPSASDLLSGFRVLELGAGTGVVGLSLARRGAAVMLTDKAACLPLIEQNIGNNATGVGNRVDVMPLDWKAVGDFWGTCARRWQPNLLLLCECIYDPMHLTRSPLVPIVVDFFRFTVNEEASAVAPRIALIAYETRDADIETAFLQQLRRAGESQKLFSVRHVSSTAIPKEAASEGNTQSASLSYEIWICC